MSILLTIGTMKDIGVKCVDEEINDNTFKGDGRLGIRREPPAHVVATAVDACSSAIAGRCAPEAALGFNTHNPKQHSSARSRKRKAISSIS